MVAWACDAARRVAGEVQVRDKAGMVEIVYDYIGGSERVKTAQAASPGAQGSSSRTGG